MSLDAYAARHRHSLQDREAFWLNEADRIDWDAKPSRALDYDRPPFATWFPDGRLNLCHNAVDRWAARRPDAPALIYESTETNVSHTYAFADLLAETQAWAALLLSLGVGRGDRVLIYLPMIPEAVFAMLACARIGATHSVVFGGFAPTALAARIDDASPLVVIGADAGSRGGKVIPYKPLLDEALDHAAHKPKSVVLVDRGLAPMQLRSGEIDAHDALRAHRGASIAPVSLPADHPSYILYTSGTTGRPKGVQRDTGGYAVALAASMAHIFHGAEGETFFAASDIGWVVGHSYIVYAPLLAGMATVLYEGTPVRPDAGILWRLAEKHRVRAMFTAPTALRMLRKEDPSHLAASDLSALKALFIAGEPLDAPTAAWIEDAVKAPIFDNYWQTETGWPILTVCRGMTDAAPRLGAAGLPVYGYDVRLLHEDTGEPVETGEKGLVCIAPPLPPGCLSTVWGDDERFVSTYFHGPSKEMVYSTFDWGVQDADGFVTILGRSDDVINTAGHRLGTREIEEALCTHPAVAEAAVVGVSDPVKGQTPRAFVVLKNADDADDALGVALTGVVAQEIGGIAKPSRIAFVSGLPKTRSGKVLRRAIQAVCEGRDPGDLSTIEDRSTLDAIAALQ